MVAQSRLEACLAAPIGSSIPEKDTQIIQSPGWYQVITPSVKEATVNEVILSQVPSSEVDHRIDETFSIYDRYDLPFKWCIGPMSSPEIEPKIAAKAGATWWFRGMAIDSRQEIVAPDSIHVERVDATNFEAFLKVFLQGWGLEKFAEGARQKLGAILQPATIHRYYLASLKGEPIGVAGTVFKEGYGYLVGSVVLEKARGAGAYRALIRARLKDLAKAEVPFAVTQAREATSAPILEKLSFETQFKAKILRFDQ